MLCLAGPPILDGDILALDVAPIRRAFSKGLKPTDLPIEQPTNLSGYRPKDRQGARPCGHTLAARRADEVIE